MAVMSHMEDSESEHAMREGYEYIIGEGYVEIALREAFIKYHSWTHRRGFRPLYSSVESYLIAMQNCDAVIDAECFGSPLRTSAASKVYRYALDKLASVGVEVFKTRHLA